MENLNGMPTSEEKNINGVPREILQMREAQLKETEAQRAEKMKKLEDAGGENGVISSNDRNIR